jgi:hypothetical protein
MDTWFPHPAEQAVAILDACHDNLQKAFETAQANLSAKRGASDREWDFALAVAELLAPVDVAPEDMN